MLLYQGAAVVKVSKATEQCGSVFVVGCDACTYSAR